MSEFDNASATLSAKEVEHIGLNTNAATETVRAAITAPNQQKIRIVSGWIAVSAATTLTFKTNTTEIFRITFPAAGVHQLSRNGDGWMQTNEAEALNMTNSAPATVTGVLVAALVGGRR